MNRIVCSVMSMLAGLAAALVIISATANIATAQPQPAPPRPLFYCGAWPMCGTPQCPTRVPPYYCVRVDTNGGVTGWCGCYTLTP